jgi:hypothetical protein
VLTQPRLADSRLTLDQHRTAVPGHCGGHQLLDDRKLGFPLDQEHHERILLPAERRRNASGPVQGAVQGASPSRPQRQASTLTGSR